MFKLAPLHALAATKLARSNHSVCFPPTPQVVKLERAAFDSVVSYLWDEVLMPAVVGSEGGGVPGRAAPAKPSAATKRAQQEAAIKKWFEGLDAVNRQLGKVAVVRGGAAGHCGLLRSQALGQCLKRLDALLFYHLLVPGACWLAWGACLHVDVLGCLLACVRRCGLSMVHRRIGPVTCVASKGYQNGLPFPCMLVYHWGVCYAWVVHVPLGRALLPDVQCSERSLPCMAPIGSCFAPAIT